MSVLDRPASGITPCVRGIDHYQQELTHLVVTILALPPRANERVKPWLDTIADDSV
jgi:hypothetical protein